MAKVTLNTVMSDWKKFAESKRASEHERLAGASIPGGERNSAKEVPAESPEVKDKKVAPTANRENTPGAESTKLAPGVEALPTVGAGVAVEAKPLIDPNPTLDKQAERVTELANAILAGIVTHNQKTAEANKDSAKEKVTVEGPGKSEKAVEAAPKGSGPAVVKTYAKSTTAPAAVPAAAKEANDLNMDLTTEVLAKIAAIVCSTEDGAAFVQAKLDAAIGAEKTAEINAYMSKQAELYDSQVYNAQAEYEAGVKYAEQIMNDPMFKLGQEMGMASLGADPEGMPAGLPEGGLPPEALDEPMPEAGGLGGEESISSPTFRKASPVLYRRHRANPSKDCLDFTRSTQSLPPVVQLLGK